ncbi:hypothetical protein [Bacteriovorax sp. Seq25_V]|uniref:hypothetical protein n=1 Tax=Bacteriovorax sp. Seq25_V TaxID=1201288 RepID=UPI000389E7BA|nr:hypothetical protein [Bacteriovorax sp. Seq25_V]EQC47399.1 hypothetical protein M900_0665 [Bacteriovorax sp. Seq25_V]
MSQIGVGKEIVTYCSKCKLDLAHIIVVMKDEKTPMRVQCKTCNSNHSFKEKKVAVAGKTRRTSTGRIVKPRMSSEEKIFNVWDKAVKGSKEAPIKYSIRTKFLEGQLIEHPTFGTGVVDKMIDANKIEVVFEKCIKVLMHAK